MVYNQDNRPGSINGDGPPVMSLGVFGISVWSLAYIGGLSVVTCMISAIYLIYAIIFIYPHSETTIRNQTLVKILIGISICLTWLATPLVFYAHAIPFTLYGFVVLGFYVASLLFGAWDDMKNILKVVSILIACAMAAALTILPAPVAAASPDDTSQEWKVKLTVLDDQNQPLSGALAQCTSVMVWNAGNPIRFNAKMTQITDDKGEAEFDFHDDTRLKTAICAALKEPVVPDENAGSDANGAEHPSYQPKAVALVSPPLPGQEYEVALKLTERGDPGNSEDASVAPSQ